FAVAPRIKGKPHARRRIEQMPAHATGVDSARAAVHDAGHVENTLPRTKNQRAVVGRNLWGQVSVVGARVEIVGPTLSLVIAAEQAHRKAKIQREPLGNPPIVLQERFEYFIAVVVSGVLTGLRE